MTQSQSGRPRQKHGSTQQSKAKSKSKSPRHHLQPQTTGRRPPSGRANRPMDTEQKVLHATMQFLDRCSTRFKRLPILWQIITGIALVAGGIWAAKFIFELVVSLLTGLCLLAILCFFLIGLVGAVFGGGRKSHTDPITGFTEQEWDDMTDPRGNGPHSHAPDYF